MQATLRLYLEAEAGLDAQAVVLAGRGNELAFDRSPFYPGGGGQPPDSGIALLPDGTTVAILSACLKVFRITDELPISGLKDYYVATVKNTPPIRAVAKTCLDSKDLGKDSGTYGCWQHLGQAANQEEILASAQLHIIAPANVGNRVRKTSRDVKIDIISHM